MTTVRELVEQGDVQGFRDALYEGDYGYKGRPLRPGYGPGQGPNGTNVGGGAGNLLLFPVIRVAGSDTVKLNPDLSFGS